MFLIVKLIFFGNVDNVNPVVNSFLDKFPEFYLAIGDKIFKERQNGPAVSLDDCLLQMKDHTHHIGDQVIDAVVDEKISATWFYNGGNPAESNKSRKYMMETIKQLFERIGTLDRSKIQKKPFLGYCYCASILHVLQSQQLANVFHAPLGQDIDALTPLEIEYIKNAFRNQLNTLVVTGLEPLNAAAEQFAASSQQINGIVFGGLLQIVHGTIINSLNTVLKRTPYILFVEAMQLGDEMQLIKDLIERYQLKLLNIKCICIGDLVPQSGSEQTYKTEIETLAKTVFKDIPVSRGLHAGHGDRAQQLIIPMGPATIQMNANYDSLIIDYRLNKSNAE